MLLLLLLSNGAFPPLALAGRPLPLILALVVSFDDSLVGSGYGSFPELGLVSIVIPFQM